jgi:pilus assembly protein CpaE
MSEPLDHIEMDISALGAPPSDVRPVPRIAIHVFCETPEMGEIMQHAADDRRLARCNVRLNMGGIPAAIALYGQETTPSLVILESCESRDTLLADLDGLAEVCDESTRVMVIGHVNDVALYRQLTRQGVSEYLVAPLTPLQVIDSIGALYADPDTAPVGRIIACIGAKGGVGSSTVAHNLGWCVSEATGQGTVIVDYDLPFGTTGLDFNQDPIQGVADALSAPERLDDVFLERLLVKYSDNLSLFTAPATLDSDYQMDEDAYERVLEALRVQMPYIIVDLPHMWGSWMRGPLLTSDEVVITATPDLAGLRNTKNLYDFLNTRRKNDRPPHLVLNQVGIVKRPEIPLRDFADAMGTQPTLTIPYDPQLFGTAANNGQMICELNARHRISLSLNHLAGILSHREIPAAKENGARGIKGLLARFGGKKG